MVWMHMLTCSFQCFWRFLKFELVCPVSSESMAPKRSDDKKEKKEQKKTESDSEGENVDPTASSSNDPLASLNLDEITLRMKKMSLEQLEKEESSMSSDLKSMLAKYQLVQSKVRSIKKTEQKKISEKKAKERAEQSKLAKKSARETEVEVFFNYQGVQMSVMVALNTTSGQLRRLIAQKLKMKGKNVMSLNITFQGTCITDTPRRELYGLSIREGSVVDISIVQQPEKAKEHNASVPHVGAKNINEGEESEQEDEEDDTESDENDEDDDK